MDNKENSHKMELDNEQNRRDIEQTGSRSDGISSSERNKRQEGSGRNVSLWDFIERGTENLEGAELVRKELSGLDKYFKDNHFDIKKIKEEYKKDPDKDFEQLESGNEADVYALAEKNYRHINKLVQWNAFSNFRRNLNQTPLEFLINKTTLYNYYFPENANNLIGATYRKDKDGENQFNFVFDQQYIEQLLDTDGEPIKATFEEIQNDMEKRGFKVNPKSPTSYTNEDGSAIISDLHLGNVLNGKNGYLYYIDVNIRLKNRELYKDLKEQ